MRRRSQSHRDHRNKDIAAEKPQGDPGGSEVYYSLTCLANAAGYGRRLAFLSGILGHLWSSVP